jgi:GrpB-like predicted nucleotidyltransferase (UPF0157 family)/GNAT superfamily N-acetyltransferase
MSNPRKVEIVAYQANWPATFQKEAAALNSALEQHLTAIHHIGSTSIPNMPAKPIIDIMVELENVDAIQEIERRLTLLDYEPVRRHVIPHWSFFTRKMHGPYHVNLHLREKGDTQVIRHIRFRDYVIAHPDAAAAYAALKIQLATEFHDDILQYVCGKDALVQSIDTKAKLWKNAEFSSVYFPRNTGSSINTWSKEKIIKAMEANQNVAATHYAQYIDDIELIRKPGYTSLYSGLPDDTFNMILEGDFTPDEADHRIQEVIDKMTRQQLPFSWWVAPLDKPADLANRLQQAGLQAAETHIGMYLDLDQWQAQQGVTLDIRRATTRATLHDFAMLLVNHPQAFATYFDWIAAIITTDDPIEFYVGYVNDKPVTRGQLVFEAQVAGIYYISTAETARHRGYATALQNFLLVRAKSLGYHIAVLQASAEGLPLYQALGFQACCEFKEFKNIIPHPTEG